MLPFPSFKHLTGCIVIASCQSLNGGGLLESRDYILLTIIPPVPTYRLTQSRRSVDVCIMNE